MADHLWYVRESREGFPWASRTRPISVDTTQIYLHADLNLKEQTVERPGDVAQGADQTGNASCATNRSLKSARLDSST